MSTAICGERERTVTFGRRERERDLDEEIQSHLWLAAQDRIRSGEEPERAAESARCELGNLSQIKEDARAVWGFVWMERLVQDARFALRNFARTPGSTAMILLSLALSSGAAIAVFSVTYGVLLHPWPYPDADRLTYLLANDQSGQESYPALTGQQIAYLQESNSIESVLASFTTNLVAEGGDFPENVLAVSLTPGSMTELGGAALLGRTLIASDAPPHQATAPVAVLGYDFWLRRYGHRADIPGQQIRLAGNVYTIVGVMPETFRWKSADLYLPVNINETGQIEYNPILKLRRGVSPTVATAQLQPVFEQFAKDRTAGYPSSSRVRVVSLNDWVDIRLRDAMKLLCGAVALMLLIGCANVSILLVARGIVRQHELATRAATGAGRFRLIRQLLTESLALSVAGGLAGILLASATVPLIAKWLPQSSFPPEAPIHINVQVLAFSAGLIVFTALFFGLLPALQLPLSGVMQVMQSNPRTGSGTAQRHYTLGVLIAAQVALTVVLLTASGQATASFLQLIHTSLGYNPGNVMSVRINLLPNAHRGWEERSRYFEQLRDGIANLPGIAGVAISTNGTPPANGWPLAFQVFSHASLDNQIANVNLVDSNYFDVLRIPLVAGRSWTPAESRGGAPIAILNETMARRYWPAGSALGQQIRIPQLKSSLPLAPSATASDHWLQVVGIVANARNDGLRNPVRPAVYVPYTMQLSTFTQILVRTHGEPLPMLKAVDSAIHRIDPGQPLVSDTFDLRQWLAARPEWGSERLLMFLFDGFSVLALALSVLGLYSVVSHAAASRARDFGIRIALGGQCTYVLVLALKSTAASFTVGIVAGLAISSALTRLIAIWPHTVSSAPFITLGAILLLSAAAAAACLIPGWRASSSDPLIALRHE